MGIIAATKRIVCSRTSARPFGSWLINNKRSLASEANCIAICGLS